MSIAMTVFSLILGGSFLGFLQFLISRKDSKNDRFDAIVKELSEVKKEIRAIDEKGDLRDAIESRVRILRFNDELLEGRRHSKDSFDQCMSDITIYETYCQSHPKFRNNQTAMTIEHINRNYAERLEKHDFLAM
ncbi:MAG: hypothetical protein J6X83_02090 [Methanomicrobium sp.]|nr:hypothetical protein [Methanomicrobium sp.]